MRLTASLENQRSTKTKAPKPPLAVLPGEPSAALLPTHNCSRTLKPAFTQANFVFSTLSDCTVCAAITNPGCFLYRPALAEISAGLLPLRCLLARLLHPDSQFAFVLLTDTYILPQTILRRKTEAWSSYRAQSRAPVPKPLAHAPLYHHTALFQWDSLPLAKRITLKTPYLFSQSKAIQN